MKRMVWRRGVMVLAGVIASLAILSVATAAGPEYNLKNLRGWITADGSSTVGPYTTAAAELFARAGASKVKVTVVINGKSRASRSDYQASEDDNVLVQGVSGERGGMGYFGYSYYMENQSRLNAVQVRNPKSGQCVAPGVNTVHNNTHKPLSRPLFIYVKGSSFKRTEVQAFFDYIFDNEVKVANRARFVSLTKAQLKRARTNFLLALKAARRG